MTQITIDIEKLGEVVAKNLPPPVPFDKQLWNSKECAAYLRKSVTVFMQHIAAHPSFPKRIRTPGTRGGESMPLWRAAEVAEWAFKHQDKR